ncbi:MAG: GNAT family N-acetyltransferase [Kiloniellaceae bacterium]
MSDILIHDYRPGDIGRVVELHGRYYAATWGFGAAFEATVAAELGHLMAEFDGRRDGFWTAWRGDDFAGGISIHGRDADRAGVRLRFFIVEPDQQGHGVGEALMRRAMGFCDAAGVERVHLWTFKGLDAARRLYERHGFRLDLEHEDNQWGRAMLEQKFVRENPGARLDSA